MTNRDRFLAGESFFYRGYLYRYSNDWLLNYLGARWNYYAACDPSNETALCVIYVFGNQVTEIIDYTLLSFGTR